VEEDKLIALGMFKYTYGFWEIIRNDIRNCQHLLFNWAAQTRTVHDIQKRADYLVRLFKEELYDTPPEKPIAIEVQEKPEKLS
jgi:hypothetical protein